MGSTKEDENSPESGSLSILIGSLNACICMGVWYYQILAPYLDQSFGKVMSMLDLLQYCNQWQIPIEKTRSRSEGMEVTLRTLFRL